MTSKLTLNLGVRYDLTVDSFAQYGEFLPFMEKGRPQDADNIQPRLGFAYQWNDRTVVRGGSAVLRRSDHAGRAVRARAGHHRHSRSGQRRPAGLRGQSVQRSRAHIRAGQTRFCSAPSRPPTSPRGAPGISPVRRRACSGEPARWRHRRSTRTCRRRGRPDRRAATDRELDVGRGRLCTPAVATKVHPGERQPHLTNAGGIGVNNVPGDCGSCRERGCCRIRVRHRRDDAVHGSIRVSRAADRLQQADEQPRQAGATTPSADSEL